MRKIMIYTKHGLSAQHMWQSIKMNADTVLFLTVYICGLMIGCSLYFSLGTDNVFAKAASHAAENGIMQNVLLRTVVCVLILLCGVISGTAAVGVIPLLLLPLFTGALYGMIASQTILCSAANGLGRFSLTLLPGGVIYSAALVFFCAESALTSKKAAAVLFFGRNEEIDQKRYLIKAALYFLVMMAGVMLDYVTNLLFGQLL